MPNVDGAAYPLCARKPASLAASPQPSILQALEDNGVSVLHSIDLHYTDGVTIPVGKELGWMIPEHLKRRWRLVLGEGFKVLPRLLNGWEQTISSSMTQGTRIGIWQRNMRLCGRIYVKRLSWTSAIKLVVLQRSLAVSARL